MMIPIISFMYGLNIERKTFAKMVYGIGMSDYPRYLIKVSSMALHVKWYNNRLPPLIR
jgi:hypothetical protein